MICSSAFTTLGRAQARALGIGELPIVVMPHPFGSRSRDEITAVARQCTQDVVTRIASPAVVIMHDAHTAEGRRAERVEAPEDQDEFDRFCRERGWSDGLPLVRPTQPRVARLLAHAGAAPETEIAAVAPGFGIATVEAIAVNAAMTGCDPRALPLLIAAVQAVCEPAFNLQGIQATTNPAATWIIVNGPLGRTLGVNAGLSCLGPGTWANATLGRALRLILQNIGGARGGDMDRATHGSPGKYTLCCAELEETSPWAPLHVERGFAADASTVTVVAASGTLNMNCHAKDADDLLRAFADTMAHPTSNDYWFGGEPWIILSPEHAEVLHVAGLSKAEVKRRLWEQSRMQAARFSARDFARTRHTRRTELGEIAPDTMLPIAPGPEGIGIIVAGGAGTHSVYVPTFGNTRSVTRPVRA